MSCSHQVLIKDPLPPSIDSNYLVGETTIIDRYDAGYNGVTVKKGESTANKQFAVHTAGDGELFVIGSDCGIDEAFVYHNSEDVNLSLSKYFGKTFEESCLIDIVMFPKFPGFENSESPIRGMKSKVFIHVIPEDTESALIEYNNGETHVGFAMMQLRERLKDKPLVSGVEPRSLDIVAGGGSGMLLIEGCGVSIKRVFNTDKISIRIEDLLGESWGKDDGCIYFGAVIKDNTDTDFPELRFAIGISVFGIEYQKLSAKLVSSPGSSYCTVYGSSYVSYTYVDKTMYNVNSIKFRCYDQYTYRIRQYTTQGRGLVMLIKNKEAVWIR